MWRGTRCARSPPRRSRRSGAGLQLDGLGTYPAGPLPRLEVRPDVAGPSANTAVHVEADKLNVDIGVGAFPIRNAELLPASARRAEADGTRLLRHLNPSSRFCRSSPSFRTPTPR